MDRKPWAIHICMTLPASNWCEWLSDWLNVDQMICIIGQQSGNTYALNTGAIPHTHKHTLIECLESSNMHLYGCTHLDMQFKCHIVKKEAAHMYVYLHTHTDTRGHSYIHTSAHSPPCNSMWPLTDSLTHSRIGARLQSTHRTKATGQMCLVTPFTQTPFRVIWRLMRYN